MYDNPIAFSLRDGDGVINEPLEHNLPLKRYRLDCYAIENLLLTDPCLAVMNATWDGFVEKAKTWIAGNPSHSDIGMLQQVITSDVRLRHTKIKKIRQLICTILDCKKPWEVVVGQAIGALKKNNSPNSDMLIAFLGAKMVGDVIFREDA